MSPPRRSIHLSSEQMAQQKGLSKEIAARSLVTRIQGKIQEEQTLGGSEIASARQEQKPPSLPAPAPHTPSPSACPLSGTDRGFCQQLSKGGEGSASGFCPVCLSNRKTAPALNTMGWEWRAWLPACSLTVLRFLLQMSQT